MTAATTTTTAAVVTPRRKEIPNASQINPGKVKMKAEEGKRLKTK